MSKKKCTNKISILLHIVIVVVSCCVIIYTGGYNKQGKNYCVKKDTPKEKKINSMSGPH